MPQIEFHAPQNLFDQIAHPYPASQAIPEWLKHLPMDRGGGPTVKRCPPLLEAMTAGYIIPVPYDVRFECNADGMVSASSDVKSVTGHFPTQYQGTPFERRPVLKVHNPWVIVTPPGYVCLITAPINRFESALLPLTGIVETDTYYREVHVPTVCMLAPGESEYLKRGTPLIQVIPMQRETWGHAIVAMDEAKRTEADKPFESNSHHYKDAVWKKLTFG
jgi:hypothetical protein